jgi:MFS family permease
MWVACVSLLFFKINPLKFVEEGGSPIVRAGLFLALGYIVGFILQTLLFPILADTFKLKIGTPETVKSLGEQIQRILTAKLPESETQWLLASEHLPEFCKFYILEYSKELKHIVLEKEDDINFMVANIIPGPLLAFSWMIFDGYRWWVIAAVVIGIIIMIVLLIRRLKHYLRKEKEEWYEIFLLLQIGGVERKNVADVEAAP